MVGTIVTKEVMAWIMFHCEWLDISIGSAEMKCKTEQLHTVRYMIKPF